MNSSPFAENMRSIRARIDQAARCAGRVPEDVALMAVSKAQSMEAIRAALDTGQRLFGENRVQEAQEHWTALRASGLYPDLRLHLIGPLQTNKVAAALALFDVVETLDRPDLAQALAAAREKTGRSVPCFIQVNTGEEPQKHGIAPGDLPVFVEACRSRYRLEIVGLMAVPPIDEPPALHFALLAHLARQNGLQGLSMGMSGDFERAITLGATVVRVGSVLFGSRT